jgi:hypothetical protein
MAKRNRAFALKFKEQAVRIIRALREDGVEDPNWVSDATCAQSCYAEDTTRPPKKHPSFFHIKRGHHLRCRTFPGRQALDPMDTPTSA